MGCKRVLFIVAAYPPFKVNGFRTTGPSKLSLDQEGSFFDFLVDWFFNFNISTRDSCSIS